MIAGNISGDISTSTSIQYNMRALRAEFFTEHPTESILLELLTPDKQAYDAIFSAKSWLWPHRLFIITGLRIAVGFHSSSNQEVSKSAGMSADPAGALLATGAPMSANAEVAGSMQRSSCYSSTVDGEIVLAYRLARISPRGWKSKALSLNEYRLSDAGRVLGADSGKERADRGDIEVTEATGADIVPLDDEEDEELGMKARVVTLEDEFVLAKT